MDQQQTILTTNSPASQETTASASTPVAPVASTPSVNEVPVQPVAQASVEPVKQATWRDNLSAEVKALKTIEKFTSVDDLVKSYANLETLSSKRWTDLTPTEKADYYGSVGRPTDKSQYTLPDELNQDAATWLKDTAYSIGLKQEQAKKIADDLVLMNRAEKDKAIAARNQMQNETVEILKREFGAAYDARLNIANKAVSTYGSESVKKLLDDTGLGNHPDVIKMFANIGKNLLEDRILTSEVQQTFKTTPAEARAKLNELVKDKSFVGTLVNPNVSGHEEAKRTYKELQNAAYGI